MNLISIFNLFNFFINLRGLIARSGLSSGSSVILTDTQQFDLVDRAKTAALRPGGVLLYEDELF